MEFENKFPMPKSINIDEATMTDTYSKFIAYPFQIGYGHTLGNALRRVLLSSLPGAAICAVRFNGANHEFGGIDNVIEDVAEIVLNLKKVRLALYSEDTKRLEIRKDTAGAVTAADIACDSTVEVLNPDQIICTLDKDKPFRAEIDVCAGRGYKPSEEVDINGEVDTIAVDCLFSPVTRVNYQVGATRLGEETEMDKLEIEIWTDGRISPRGALEKAARILCDHLQPFLGTQTVSTDTELNDEELALFKVLSRDVETLELSVRAMNCLNTAGIRLIYELCTKTESRLLKFRNFGKKSLDEIVSKISNLNLSLGMTLNERLSAALDQEVNRIRNNSESVSEMANS